MKETKISRERENIKRNDRQQIKEKNKKREKGKENERNMKRKIKQRENWLNERGGVKKIKREKEKDRKK